MSLSHQTAPHVRVRRTPARRKADGAGGAEIHVLTTPEAVLERAGAWDAGIASGPLGPLTRPAWFAGAAATLAPDGALRFVVVEEDGRLTAAAPLVEGPHDRLELLGAEQLPEPGDFAARDSQALATLARGVAALRRPLWLPRVPAGSFTPHALRAATGHHGLVVTRPAQPWPTLWLDSVWATGEGRLSKRRAGDIRRARRRADAVGNVETEHHQPTAATVDELFTRALEVEAGGWKGRSRSALKYDPVRLPFFVDWARRATADGSLRIAFLTIAGEDVAVQVASEASNRRWILKIGHTDAHARCSPGLLLLLDTVQDAAQRGLDAVELLGTTEPWTTAWTSEVSETLLVRTYPQNVAGARRLLIDGRRAVIRRASRNHSPNPEDPSDD